MTMKVGYRRGVTPNDLAKAIPSDDFQWMILENAGEVKFSRFDRNIARDYWDEGVLFGEKTQLRFRRRRDGNYHLVLLTDTLPNDFTPWGQAVPSGHEEQRFLLWGEWDDTQKAWVEARLPKKFQPDKEYPLPPDNRKRGQRLALKVEIMALEPASALPANLFDPTPPPLLERYLGVEEVESEK